MPRQLISSGSDFEKVGGYSRAVVQGNWCFVAGTTGYDYETMEMPKSVVEQAKNTLATIEKTLNEAGFSKEHIVRANYIVTDKTYADEVFPVFGDFFKGIQPAATIIIAGLLRPEMKIEIEVTALKDN